MEKGVEEIVNTKEIADISGIISKYSRARLYCILRDEMENTDFKPAVKTQIKNDGFSLLIEEGKIFFIPAKNGRKYPLLFSIEDLNRSQKGYLEFGKEALCAVKGKEVWLKAEWNGLRADVILKSQKHFVEIDARIKSNSPSEMIVRAGVELNVDAVGWNWCAGIRDICRIKAEKNYYLLSREYKLGKSGKLPVIYFGNISDDNLGFVLGVNPQEPRIFEITYDSREKQFQLFFDMAISPKTKKFPNEVSFSAFLFCLEEHKNTGFRKAVEKYYQIFPEGAVKRIKKEGNWMPFSDISSISQAEDFHFACHELNVHYDGRVRSKADIDYNAAKGIYNFAYTEPWLYWLHMPKEMARTYEEALSLMEKNLNSDDEKTRDFASAGLLCSMKTPGEKYYLRFQDAPWCNGAVVNTNTDPVMETNEKCPINRAGTELKQIIRCLNDTRFHGAYLDSMQSAELTQDYDEKHFETTEFPLTFEKDVKKPAICQFISAHHFTELLADYLHKEGKLLMGNFPAGFTFFVQHVDVPGEEVVWMEKGRYNPLDDRELSMRRVLSYRKPYLFLQSVNFDAFTKEMVEKYMKRCLFYGMFPSMFSFNAQDASYWENPKWYNRDRDLFKKYLPHITNLSKAGWEPVQSVSVDNEKIFIEQFGTDKDKKVYVTESNQTSQLQRGKIDFSNFISKNKLTVKELLSNKSYSADVKNPFVDVQIEPDDVVLFEVSR